MYVSMHIPARIHTRACVNIHLLTQSDEVLYCSICSKELENTFYNCDCEKHKTRYVCGGCIVPRVRQEQTEQR